MKSILFAPNDNKVFFRGIRLNGDYHLPYRQRTRFKYLDSLPLNQRTLISIWSKLHYKSSHSVGVVHKKWKNANLRFQKNHFGSSRMSSRFANQYTANKWM